MTRENEKKRHTQNANKTKQTQPIVNTHTHTHTRWVHLKKKSSSEDGLSVVKQHTQKRREGKKHKCTILSKSIRFHWFLSLSVCVFRARAHRSMFVYSNSGEDVYAATRLCTRSCVCECVSVEWIRPSHPYRQAWSSATEQQTLATVKMHTHHSTHTQQKSGRDVCVCVIQREYEWMALRCRQ